MSTRLLALLSASSLLACGGEEGTISITVVSAPDSELLPQIETLQATLTNPLKTFESSRKDDGSLSLGIDLEADGRSGDLIVEGRNSQGETIAVGRVGPLPLVAVDASIVVYLGPPLGLSEAPVRLDVPRSHIGSTAASFGVLLAGGRDQDGPLPTVDVYNTYLHDLQVGEDMPAALSETVVVPGSTGYIYMLGGTGVDGEPSSEAFAFDTTVGPAGVYRSLVLSEENARSGASAALVGQDLYVVSGDPGLLLDGFQGTARPLQNGEGLDGPAVTLVSGNNLQVLFAGAGIEQGAAIYELATLRRLSPPAELVRSEHRGVSLPTNEALFLGGAIDGVATTSAVLYKPASTSFQVLELLATPRRNPAVAVTGRYLVVVGGEDDTGAPVADIEVFDATSLDPVTRIPLQVPRSGASAEILRNGQVLISGGIDADGEATGVLELFTPDE